MYTENKQEGKIKWPATMLEDVERMSAAVMTMWLQFWHYWRWRRASAVEEQE
jgi:hypothetical protein